MQREQDCPYPSEWVSYLSEAEDGFTLVHRVFVPLLLKGKELERAVKTQLYSLQGGTKRLAYPAVPACCFFTNVLVWLVRDAACCAKRTVRRRREMFESSLVC